MKSQGMVVGTHKVAPFYKPVKNGVLDWFADDSPCWNPPLPSLPWKASLSGALSQAMGVTNVKLHRNKTSPSVSKVKKKDELQWKCYLKITDLSHLFR